MKNDDIASIDEACKEYSFDLKKDLYQDFLQLCKVTDKSFMEMVPQVESHLMSIKKKAHDLTKAHLKQLETKIIKSQSKVTPQKRKQEDSKKVTPVAPVVKSSPQKPLVPVKIEVPEVKEEKEIVPLYTKTTLPKVISKSVFKTFNPDLKCVPNATNIVIESQSPLITKYMNKLDGENLKRRFFDFSKAFSVHYQVDIAEPGTTLEESWYIGRILCDSVTGQDKLNRESILFESLTQDGQSLIIRLKTDREAHLYAGQLVGVCGIWNKSLLATKIHFGIPPTIQSGVVSETFKVTIAHGPFDHEFDSLLDLIQRQTPNIVILMGPFLGENVTTSYLKAFEEICSKMTVKTILIPSTKDVFHHCVFPQPKFEILNRDMICLSNPSLFTIQGLSFGCTSSDVLSHIPIHPIETCLEQFLNQNTFYPFFGMNGSEPVDWNLIDNLTIPKMPQVLLIPSNQQFLIQSVQGTLIINPKRSLLTNISVCAGNTCLERIKVEML